MHSWHVEVPWGCPHWRVLSLGAPLPCSLPLGFLPCLHDVLLLFFFSSPLRRLAPLLVTYSLSHHPPPLVGKAYLFLGPLRLCSEGLYWGVQLGGPMSALWLVSAPKVSASLPDKLFCRLVLHLEHMLHSGALYKEW